MTSAREWERRIQRLARHTPQDPEALAVMAEAAREQDAGDLAVARMKGLLPFGAKGCTEDVEHRALVLWVEQEGLATHRALRWLHHSPNEAAYRGQQGKGVRAGVVDFILFASADSVTGRYVGCALELKGSGGKPSPEQLEWLAHLRSEGWFTRVTYGYEATRDALIAYLSGKA